MTTDNKNLLENKQTPKRFDLLDNKLMGALGLRVASTEVIPWKEKLANMVQKGLNRDDWWGDGDFMDDVRQATLRGAHPAAILMFNAMVAFLFIFVVWAIFARIDEVSHAQGMVIPSGKIQAVGSPEGGVVSQIFVKAGDIVKPGQELVRMDDSGAIAGVGEKEQRQLFLKATIARLQAELNDTPLNLPEDVLKQAPTIVAEAQTQYETRKAELQSTTGVFKEQMEQRRQEANDARRRAGSLREAYVLAKKELDMTRPYLDSGAISKVDVLRLERAVVEAQKDLSTAQIAIPTAEAAVREAQQKLEEATLRFKNDSRDQLAKAQDELNRLGAAVGADIGRVERTQLKSPVLAEVKQVLVNTVGQAVQPNTNIVELVPLEDSLLVEAHLKPQDVAFIRPAQKANVKITAYDSSIYGGLDGKVETLSPDSFTTEKGDTYYKVMVRTNRNFLEHNGQKFPIKSGMVATVDILTGKKTVMQYLLKPINKARQSALTER